VHQLQVDQAQAISQGQGVTVAVLDSGVDMTHPMLAGRLLPGYDFVDDDATPHEEFNGLDDDDDGFIDEIAGHGTHVAGVVHLVAPAAHLMPLRVLDSDGQGDSFIIAEAMLYAAAHGADVLNMSLGSVWPSTFLLDVVEQVSAQGVLVVAAAGNLDTDIAQYPAASPCALGVTAVGPGPHKSEFASYGPWIDVAAPGDRIYSTYPGGYSWWRGTSMATPFVAGQAALLLGADPTLSLTTIGQYVTGTAQPLHDPDYEGQLGAGRIAIGDSLSALNDGAPPGDAPDPFQTCTP
jgi:subtilisin family serine protease